MNRDRPGNRQSASIGSSFLSTESIWRDIRFAVRSLLKAPGFMVVAILVIAVGIGANTAIFSLIDTVLVKTLPVDDPQRFPTRRSARIDQEAGISFPAGKDLEPQVVVEPLSGLALPFRATGTVSMTALIARAGGFGPKASQRRVAVRRRDGSVIHADLLLYSQTGDVKHNPYVLDGDVVRVPFQELAASIDGGAARCSRLTKASSKRGRTARRIPSALPSEAASGGLAPSRSTSRRLPPWMVASATPG